MLVDYLNKFKKRTLLFINIFFLIFIIFIFLLVISYKEPGYSTFGTTIYFSPIWTLPSLLVAVGLIYILVHICNFLKKINFKKYRLILFSILIIYFTGQILFLTHFKVIPSWDFGEVIKSSTEIIRNHQLDSYLAVFRNNIPAAILLAFFNLLGVKSISALGFLNIIFINIAFVFFFLTLKKIIRTKRYFGLIFVLMWIIFLPLLLYIPIVYTDTLSLPFIAIGIYLLTGIDGKITTNIYKLMFAVLIITAGVLIKQDIIIVIIASIIILFIYGKNKYVFILPLLIFLIINFMYSSILWGGKIIKNNTGINNGIPYTHYLMMGQNTNTLGLFDGGDNSFTLTTLMKLGIFDNGDNSFTFTPSSNNIPIKQIESVNIHTAKQRLFSRGIRMNLSFFVKKISKTWNEPDFFAIVKLKRQPIYPDNINWLEKKPQSSIIIFIMRSFYIMILALCLYASGYNIINKSKEPQILTLFKLSLLGIFIFLIFWETRSRYLLNFAPFLIVYGAYGLYLLRNKIDKKISSSELYHKNSSCEPF